MIKPLDIVRVPKGAIAIVTECSPASNNLNINRYSINYLDKKDPLREYNAWWDESELIYINSIPILIAEAMCHPFGNNRKHVKQIFQNITN